MRQFKQCGDINFYYEENLSLTEENMKDIIRHVKEYIVKEYDRYLKLNSIYVSRPFASSPMSIYFQCIKEDVILYNK